MGLYSQAAKAASALPQAKGTGQQMLASLKGVKPEEMKWSGANEAFADRPSVTKDELAQHFQKSMPHIQETVLNSRVGSNNPAKFSDYTIPGGENYREVLMHLPLSKKKMTTMHVVLPSGRRRVTSDPDEANLWKEMFPGSKIEHVSEPYDANSYLSSHWDQPNVLAHLRLSDRQLPDGSKALHMEELQSDWAQKGRKEGFYDPAKPYEAFDPDNGKVVSTHATEKEARIAAEATDNLDYANSKFHGKVPAAPYVNNTNSWTDLGLKRALLEAARGGHNKLIWTPGETQAERYDISKHIKDMQATPVSEDHVRIVGFAPKEEDEEHGDPIFNEVHHIDKIDDVVGKEVADKIRQRIVMKGEKTGHAVVNRDSGFVGSVFSTPEEAEQDRQRYPSSYNLEVRPHTGKEIGRTVFLPNSDLKVGTKGMKGYYDDIVPKRLLALAREHDPEASIGSQRIDNHDDPLPSLTITPKMRDSILSKGFKSFARGGDVEPEHMAVGGDADDGNHPALIPQRLITSKRATNTDQLNRIDLDALKQDPKLFAKNVELVRSYPNMRQDVADTADHHELAEHFINHVTDNLLALHDAVPEHIRNRSKLWYDGARNIINDWTKKYNLPDHSVAGVIASMSPQKDWYQNVSLAKRVLDIHRGMGDNFYHGFGFSPEMEGKFTETESMDKPEMHAIAGLIRGKSLGDIDKTSWTPEAKTTAKALWTRLYDEAHHQSAFPIVSPEGDFGEHVQNKSGEKSKVGWGSLTEISKAIKSIEAADDPKAISQIMGGRHKVRNFYNNMLSPNSPHGDVTIDTHAVAAGLMRPLSGNSLEVAQNFGNYPGKGLPAAGGSALTGVQGTYPLHAEAYRRAAEARGIHPREMQSITWEAIRGLFPDAFKTAKNNSAVNDIWNEYRHGRIDQNEARQQIHTLAGGIENPTWFRPSGTDEVGGGADDEGELPVGGIRGQAPQGFDAGAGRGIAAPFASNPPRSPSPPAIVPIKENRGEALNKALRIAANAARR
jgi:hypothetical protein